MADARGLILRDYFAREELAVANAVPTAEGAVQLAMEQMPVTIHGARVLITGFGRVGQAVALALRQSQLLIPPGGHADPGSLGGEAPGRGLPNPAEAGDEHPSPGQRGRPAV